MRKDELLIDDESGRRNDMSTDFKCVGYMARSFAIGREQQLCSARGTARRGSGLGVRQSEYDCHVMASQCIVTDHEQSKTELEQGIEQAVSGFLYEHLSSAKIFYQHHA